MANSYFVHITGIAWFRREHYPRIRAMFSDADYPESYDDWLNKAEAGIKHHEKHGDIAIKVILEPDEFTQWCNSLGRDIDSDAKHDFVVLMAKRAYDQRNT